MKLFNHMTLLLILCATMKALISSLCNNHNQAVGQEYISTKLLKNDYYILLTDITQEDDFCKKYLGSCPSNNGNSPSTNSQPSNDNYANEFEKKYQEKNSSETETTELQPPMPRDYTNETLANEMRNTPPQLQPHIPDKSITPPLIPPTF